MIEYLNQLRQKTDVEKRRIALLVSGGITLVIFVFWISSFGPVTTTSNTGVANVVSPFESVKNNLSSVYDSIIRKGGEFNDAFNKNEHSIEVVSGNTPK